MHSHWCSLCINSSSSRVSARGLGEVSNLSSIIVECRICGEPVAQYSALGKHVSTCWALLLVLPYVIPEIRSAWKFNLRSYSLSFPFSFTSKWVFKIIYLSILSIRIIKERYRYVWGEWFLWGIVTEIVCYSGALFNKFFKEFLEPIVDWVSGNSPELFLLWQQWAWGLACDYPGLLQGYWAKAVHGAHPTRAHWWPLPPEAQRQWSSTLLVLSRLSSAI